MKGCTPGTWLLSAGRVLSCALLAVNHPLLLQLLQNLADAANLRGKIDAMFSGEHINTTEDRAVLHVACRAHRDQVRP